ncbi:MAG: YceI family protein [Spirochaetaceae bacterium]|nr:MAG: YceI family protein [Spirochaetaceae bacterium]
MSVIKKTVIAVLGVVVIAFAAVSIYIYVAGGSGEATREVQARRVEPRQEEADDRTGREDDSDPQQPQPAPPRVYAAVPGRSEARFLIDEVLRGSPNTVTGRTDQVDGSLAVRLDPALIEIGEFEINLRTIATDDEMRDRTIRSMILETNRDEYEFSTFVPTSIEGVPETIELGATVNVQVKGDLTVRDVTRSVSFEMAIVLESEDEVRGSAGTSFTWDEFEISIPYVGGNSIVSAVDDTVRIEMDFLARAVDR